MREEYTAMKNKVQDKTSIVKLLVKFIKNVQKEVEALQDNERVFEEILKNVVDSQGFSRYRNKNRLRSKVCGMTKFLKLTKVFAVEVDFWKIVLTKLKA